MKTYFISDYSGDLWAHDIPTYAEADLILGAKISSLEENGETIPEGLEVLEDDISEEAE